jgi:uncharacterized protein YjeT (DUF2065 family)
VKPSDPDAAKLLRWYPRAWRERYGEEFLAMVEDTLDGRRPTWRLRLGVAWAGLRERGRRRFSGRTAAAWRRAGYKALFGRWWAYFLAGYLFAVLPYDLRASPPPARAWPVSAMLDAVAATAVFIGVAVLVLLAGSRTYHQLTGSLAFALILVVTGLLLMVAFRLWARAAKATVRHLDLALRVRAGEMMLAVVTATAVSVMLAFNIILSSAIDSSVPMLLLGVAGLAAQGAAAPMKMKQAVRRSRRLRAAAGRGR